MTYLKALAKFVVTLFAASIAIFLLMRAVPGNPARVALGVNATDDAVAELTTALGLDRPLLTQYFDWVGGLLSGNFGTSLASQQDITPLVVDRAQVSLILVGLAILLALAGAVPIGMWLARTGNTFVSARALGLSHAEALRRHGLRNAALPVLTVTGLQLTTLIVGAVVIESVFVIPGLGSMLLDAVSNRDLTTVQTLVMLLVFFTLAINLATDLAYRVIDPRLKEKR